MSGVFFGEMDGAADSLLASISSPESERVEVAANRLLAALARDRELPPVPDPETQRHFAAGLAGLKDAAETLARTVDSERDWWRYVS